MAIFIINELLSIVCSLFWIVAGAVRLVIRIVGAIAWALELVVLTVVGMLAYFVSIFRWCATGQVKTCKCFCFGHPYSQPI